MKITLYKSDENGILEKKVYNAFHFLVFTLFKAKANVKKIL